MTQVASDTIPRPAVPPPIVTGLSFRTVTSFYHSPIEFPYAIADLEQGGGLYVLEPLEPLVMPKDMAVAAVERLKQYGVIDTSSGDLDELRRQALEARAKWLLDNWRFTLATVEQARVKGMVLTSKEDRRDFMRQELAWVNKQLGTDYQYATLETPSPKAEKDVQNLQATIAMLQAQVTQLAMQLSHDAPAPEPKPRGRPRKEH